MKTVALVLEYDEGTCSSVLKDFDKKDIIYVDRQGVGSMATAFNEALRNLPSCDYVWWITNVEFERGTKDKLVDVLKTHDKACAVHPQFNSDHPHIRFGSGKVPFIEFTAPMFKLDYLLDVGEVDENMLYWGFDLDWSYRAIAKGYELYVDNKSTVDHIYNRHMMKEHPVTQARALLREYYDDETILALISKYGKGWKTVLNFN